MQMKAKVEKIAKEMSEMIYWIADIEKKLQQQFTPDRAGLLTKEQTLSLSKFYNQQICNNNKFEFLTEEENEVFHVILEVCNFRYTALDGARLLKEMRNELIEARDLINV